MRNVELTPEESLLLHKLESARGDNLPLPPHGNNRVVVTDENEIPKAVRAVKAMKALGWKKALVDSLVAKLQG